MMQSVTFWCQSVGGANTLEQDIYPQTTRLAGDHLGPAPVVGNPGQESSGPNIRLLDEWEIPTPPSQALPMKEA